MNPFSVFACRVYQKTLFIAQTLMNFPIPETMEGEGALKKIPDYLKAKNKRKPLLVADPFLVKSGAISLLTKPLEEAAVSFALFDEVVPNPPFPSVEKAYSLYESEGCDCLIAIGGGSSLDTAKAVGAKATDPKKTLDHFKGILKVRRKIPLLIAIPTTAGTGSEATLAAVVVNPKTKDKFSINDPHLIPSLAVLDPGLLCSLPQKLIASTGMDALTHAIESYIGCSRTKLTKSSALEAISLIRDHLYAFYRDPTDAKEASSMQKAAFLAGVSFTRGYVGYVHALAHALGGYYNLPHGYANAVLLPHVLSAYGKKAERKLADIAATLNLTQAKGRSQQAQDLIAWIKSLNASMGIPEGFSGVIQEKDLPLLSAHACKEGNPLYPVPKEMGRKQLMKILEEVRR